MRQAVSNQQAVSKSHKSAGNIRSIYMEEDDEAHTVTFPDNSDGDTVCQICKSFNSNQEVSFQDTRIKDIEKELSSMKDSTEKHFTEILDALKSRSHEPSPHLIGPEIPTIMIVEILTPHTEVPFPQVSISIPHVIPIHIPQLKVPILQIDILQIDHIPLDIMTTAPPHMIKDHIPLDIMTTTPPHMIKDHILLIDTIDEAVPQTNMKAILLIETVAPIPLIGMTIDLRIEEEMIAPSMNAHMTNLNMILEEGVQALDQVLLIPQGPVPLLGTMRKSLPLRPF